MPTDRCATLYFAGPRLTTARLYLEIEVFEAGADHDLLGELNATVYQRSRLRPCGWLRWWIVRHLGNLLCGWPSRRLILGDSDDAG